MKSYEVVSLLLIADSIITYLYTKNVAYLVIGLVVGLIILFGVRIIFEKFAV